MTLLDASPAAAAVDPSSTTTTTEGPIVRPAPSVTTTPGRSSTTTSTTAPATATPDVSEIPSAGPPLVHRSGILLPGDSFTAAVTELGLLRARGDTLAARQAQVATVVATDEQLLTGLRAHRHQQSSDRRKRAIAAYRGQATGWRLGVLTRRSLADERAVYLIGLTDAAAKQKLRQLDRQIQTVDLRARAERDDLADVEKKQHENDTRVAELTDKLAAASGTLGIVGAPSAIAAGSSAIALLADVASNELSRVLNAGIVPAADPVWLTARNALLTEMASASSGERKAVTERAEHDWDVTPPALLRVVLFALRQVGKPYIYATAGPDTFDCSGLTKRAYAELRIGLPHFSGAQLHLGIPVAPDALRPADLLTYGPDGSEHVTMYVGAGLVVEARGRAWGVIVATVRTDPAKGFAGATRIVP